MPWRSAVTVTSASRDTCVTGTRTAAVVAPEGTMTVDGTGKSEGLLELSLTVIPPFGAGLASLTETRPTPPPRIFDWTVIEVSRGGLILTTRETLYVP